ncbi:hypothetical protein A7K91_00015 [Paenibacillus oryzae]|uniref:Uncharacterized protein n=1 Tax=Paenibacillus oryzae TaxID=1844972 RepID=A0A1A5YHV2_9BACL|nr:hypothetical protein A7K91_00015 [Paenibacillus oryzae]
MGFCTIRRTKWSEAAPRIGILYDSSYKMERSSVMVWDFVRLVVQNGAKQRYGLEFCAIRRTKWSEAALRFGILYDSSYKMERSSAAIWDFVRFIVQNRAKQRQGLGFCTIRRTK